MYESTVPFHQPRKEGGKGIVWKTVLGTKRKTRLKLAYVLLSTQDGPTVIVTRT